MTDYSAQLDRIRTKLDAARAADPEYKVFGASKHRYGIGPPLSEESMAGLEADHGCQLPPDLRAFLTTIGNGNDTPEHAAAGPYYGINSAKVICRSANLDHDPLVEPHMTDARWEEIQKQIASDPRHTNEVFSAGCAWLVDQGCSYFNLIALRGPQMGRVIYFDEDLQKPSYAFEPNFLDWYERWLDEVAAGYLSQGGASWFGMTMGGDDRHLLEAYAQAPDNQTREDALCGLFKLPTIAPESVDTLTDIAKSPGRSGQLALNALIRFAPDAAAPFLTAAVNDPSSDIQSIAREIRVHALQLYPPNAVPFRNRLAQAEDHETFAALTFLMIDAGESAATFAPFLDHSTPAIRRSATYAMGKASNRAAHIDDFTKALSDNDEGVTIAALQAIKGLSDPRLAETFPSIRQRFANAERHDGRNYVLTNLKARETEFTPVTGWLNRLLNR